MAWTTEGCRSKLARVDANLDALDEQNGAYVQTKPWAIRPEFEPETGWHSVRIDIEPPGPDFGLIIGEAAHNLRSALDHLAWQLATLDGEPPDPKRVQFPIFSEEPKDFLGLRSLNGMREEHRTILESLQPYNAGHGRTHLEAIAWINNTDKHRTLHTVAFTARELVPHIQKAYEGYEIRRSEFGYEGVLENNTEVGRVLVEPTSPDLKMYMQFAPTIGVAFGDPASAIYGFSADGLLKLVKTHVQTLIDVFDRPGASGAPPWP